MPEPDDKPLSPDDLLRVDWGQPAEILRDPGFMQRVREQEKEADERRQRQMRERAEQARRDAIASFTAEVPGGRHWVCPSCAALVGLHCREKHLDWHADLAATAAQASRAHFYNTPIG